MHYRRLKIPGASYFFTVNLANRKSTLLLDEINKLKVALATVKAAHPFQIDGIVVLPEHLHMIMTLPGGDSNYSQRGNLIKGHFSRSIVPGEGTSLSRKNKGERGIWQRRYWEHRIRDENDFEKHIDYIHYNPVKHGYVEDPFDWKYSSIHRYYSCDSKDVLVRNEYKKEEFGE